MIKVDIAVNVTKDDVNAMIDCEDILKELTEICENIPAKCDDRLDESLANAVENEKMSSVDISSIKNLTNAVNEGKNTIINGACKILEYNSNSRENVTVKSDDVIGETHLDASCRSSCLMAAGDIRSDGTKESTSFNSENNESSIEYQENSGHSFTQLQERKKPIEITKSGKTVLSNTENGESSVLYEPNFYIKEEAHDLFEYIYDSTNWLDKNIVIRGIEYPQPRLVAWYGPLPYSYSGTSLEAAEMPDCVLSIKSRVEDYLRGKNINVELNSVLMNLYRDNKDSVSWHSDDEFTMGVCPTIASISLGETRKFEMRPKPNRYYEEEPQNKLHEYFVNLNSGSLIVMDGCMQEDWQHRVPKEYHDRDARINLTFRTVYAIEKGVRFSKSRKSRYFQSKYRKRRKLETENDGEV